MTAIPQSQIKSLEDLNKELEELIITAPNPEEDELVEQVIGEPIIDFFSEAVNDIDNFEEFAWETGEGYKSPSYPIVTEKLEGYSQGLYLLAGPSNAGKSAMMMNMMYDLCMHEENKLFGIYFSLDDSRNEIIPRVVAMDQRIPISAVSKPARYQNFINAVDENGTQDNELDMAKVIQYTEYLEKRTEGLNKLKEHCNKFKIEDSTRCTTLKQIEEFIDKAIQYVKAIDEEMNVVVAIDSINDVQLGEGYSAKSNNEKLDTVARVVKHWTVKFGIVIFASTHLRKLNGNRRPTLDDLKESNTLVYEASVIWLVYNDVSTNKNSAKVYYTEFEGDQAEKKPVIELDWAKNKKSSYKGRTFNFFSPEHSKAIECDEQSSKRYNALVYEA